MTQKEHKQKHIELHKALDELLADYILHHAASSFSQTSVMGLMEWSYQQTQNPDEFLKKKRLTEAIAEIWDIPEDKVLSIPETGGQKTIGDSKDEYVDARKFYFYVMIEIKQYSWADMTQITGRKIAYMMYANKKAQERMKSDKEYMRNAKIILRMIDQDQIAFTTTTIIYEADAKVIDR